MQRRNESGQEGSELLHKQSSYGTQKLVDVCELENTLVGYLKLWARPGSVKYRRITYYEDELELVDKGPADSIAILLVLFIRGTALDEGIADEGVEGRGWGRGDALGVGGEGAGPEDDAALVRDGAEIKHWPWETGPGLPASRPSPSSPGSRPRCDAGKAA